MGSKHSKDKNFQKKIAKYEEEIKHQEEKLKIAPEGADYMIEPAEKKIRQLRSKIGSILAANMAFTSGLHRTSACPNSLGSEIARMSLKPERLSKTRPSLELSAQPRVSNVSRKSPLANAKPSLHRFRPVGHCVHATIKLQKVAGRKESQRKRSRTSRKSSAHKKAERISLEPERPSIQPRLSSTRTGLDSILETSTLAKSMRKAGSRSAANVKPSLLRSGAHCVHATAKLHRVADTKKSERNALSNCPEGYEDVWW